MPKKAKPAGAQPPVPVEDRRHQLDKQKKEHMLAVAIRNPDAYAVISDHLKVADVRFWSEPMAVLWQEVRKFHKQFGELPERNQLYTNLSNKLSASPDLLAPEEQTEIDAFFEYAWDPDHEAQFATSQKQLKFAVDTCGTFLEEVVTRRVQSALIKEGTFPLDIPKILETARSQLDIVQSLSGVEIAQPFPEDWDKRQGQQLVTTGVPALDAFTGGGLRSSEVTLFMAPYGSCKTLTACHGVSRQMVYAAQLYATGQSRLNSKGKPMIPVVVLVFTESDINEYRDRLLANSAMVPWQRLAQMTSVKSLDAGSEPGETEETAYEKGVFKNDVKDGAPWFNEQARVQQAVTLANQHLMIVDCTDNPDNPNNLGKGGVPELAGIIRGMFQKKKETHYPLYIWVDHVSGLVDRMAEAVDSDADLIRITTNVPRLFAEKIGKPFACPIVLMHQFAGAVQGRKATAAFHHSEAEGSKSIGKYAVFAVVSGPVDGNGMCQWSCTKHRREPPRTARILKIDGQFNRLEDATDTHGVCPGSRAIVSKSELTAVAASKFGGKLNGVGGTEDDNDFTDMSVK